MKFALVNSESDKLYTKGIVRALDERQIDHSFVDPKATNIVDLVKAYDAFIWHHSHSIAVDYLIAKPLISALEVSGIVTFPTTQDTWHFDDKIAQKYLFEALDVPKPKTEIFFDAQTALGALSRQEDRVVMKLRSGASSANVRLISNNSRGRRLIRKAFGSGFRQFDRVGMARDAWKSARLSQLSTIIHAWRETAKIIFKSQYEKVRGAEKQYVLMQEFLPENDCDVRLVVMDGKVFGMLRFNRKGDFRASGSGVFDYSPDKIPNSCVQLALVTAKRLGSTAVAFDFLFDGSNPKLIEISYGINAMGYRDCPGYWDPDGQWVPSPWPAGDFRFEDFIVDTLVRRIEERRKSDEQ